MSKSGSKRGQVWVSAILYTLVATVALVLILEAGIPILERLRDTSTFTKTKEELLNLDKQIQEVANEGEGAQRIVSLDIKDGELSIDDNQIVWEFDTKSRIVDPRTSQNYGNLIVTSNANVETVEEDDYYLLRTYIKDDEFYVKINKTGTIDNWEEISTDTLINEMSYAGTPLQGTFTFSINDDPGTLDGNGYTRMVPSGNNTNLGRAKVIAHINSTGAEYDIEITLESYSDFIITKVKNFVPKS